MTTDLIARLAEGEGADTKLDCEIDALLFGGTAAHLCVGGCASVRHQYRGSVFFKRTNASTILPGDYRYAGDYTSSLDACIALVERVLLPKAYISIHGNTGTNENWVITINKAIAEHKSMTRAFLQALIRAKEASQ